MHLLEPTMKTALFALALGTLAGLAPDAFAMTEMTDEPAHILVYSRTAGFRHSSIPDGIKCLQEIGGANGMVVDATEDPTQFTDANLEKYAAVVFLSTTGDVLDADQQGAFERFIRKGRGYVGVHAASDTEYEWPWYGKLVGGYFKNHPAIQDASIDVCDHLNLSTAHLPARWDRHDEWYNFRENPRPGVHVLATLDETSYKDGNMGADHPTVWCHLYDGGRSWYTAGGHTEESFTEPAFRKHLEGGLRWAAGVADTAPAFTFVLLNQDRRLPGTDAADPGTLAFAWPPEGGIVGPGEKVEIRVAGTATKDTAHGAHLAAYLGHDQHAHALAAPASGSWTANSDLKLALSEDTFYLLQATASGSTASTQVLLQPRRKCAAYTAVGKGGAVKRDGQTHELVLADLKPGDFASYRPVNLHGITGITLTVKATASGTIEFRADSPDGPELGAARLQASPESWASVRASVKDPGGAHSLVLVVRADAAGSSPVCSIAWIEFVGPGVSGAAPSR